jgi:hypothetical protein
LDRSWRIRQAQYSGVTEQKDIRRFADMFQPKWIPLAAAQPMTSPQQRSRPLKNIHPQKPVLLHADGEVGAGGARGCERFSCCQHSHGSSRVLCRPSNLACPANIRTPPYRLPPSYSPFVSYYWAILFFNLSQAGCIFSRDVPPHVAVCLFSSRFRIETFFITRSKPPVASPAHPPYC